ncbi:MAG TPA: glycerol-3-phosphate acyltransferase [Ktedonobacterales bacterium]|jgi:glycerol-3-phosphate acyltransferase PlsY|nr:glycerol-3-phosphate acyltransferase [Ktedonobacterales bacterium]
MLFFIWLVLSYLSGAIPWSVWLGERFFHVDPRKQSDGNPGAANAYRAAGWRLGVSVLALDFLKACLPVLVARQWLGFSGWELFWIALMPTVGHAFSIFLRLRGGRALVTMFGVWTGLTLYEVPLVMGATAILATLLLKKDEHRTLAIPLALVPYLALRGASLWLICLALAQTLILLIKIYGSDVSRLAARRQDA